MSLLFWSHTEVRMATATEGRLQHGSSSKKCGGLFRLLFLADLRLILIAEKVRLRD